MQSQLDQAIDVWQPYYSDMLTHTDAEEIVTNWSAFLNVLAEWRTAKEGRDQ